MNNVNKTRTEFDELLNRIKEGAGFKNDCEIAAALINPKTGEPMKPQAIWLWKKRGRVGRDHIVALSELSGVPCSEINPQLYPPSIKTT